MAVVLTEFVGLQYLQRGESLTIVGTGFEAVQGGGSVTLNSTTADIVSWSDTEIEVTVDAATAYGIGDVVVTNDSSDSDTQADIVLIYKGDDPMAVTITKVAPLMVAVGATGCKVYGTGFKASQTTGAITINNVTQTVTAWSDTVITFTSVSPGSGLYGAYDLKVTNSDGDICTKPDGIVILNTTEQFTSSEVKLGRMSRLYIDGVHAGFLEGEVSLTPDFTTKKVRPNDRITNIATFVTGREDSLTFTMIQVSGANLALAIGGTYDVTSKTVKLTSNTNVVEKSIAWQDAGGRQYVVHRAQLSKPAPITLSAEDNMKLTMTWDVLAIDTSSSSDEDADVVSIYDPNFS